MILYGLNKNQIIPTAKAQREKGKEARKTIPFSAQATLSPVDRDPVTLIESQNTNRLPELIDLRKERMSISPFTFYRGSALLMAHDLSKQAITGHQLIICGDAHLNNFGLYASPERRLVLDLNDFDEAAPGPWEWDLKRLVTSVILCGEDLQLRSDPIQDAAHCGFLLARAHAQSPNANWVAGYMGKSPLFDQMIVNWCYAYTKQVYMDYEKFIKWKA